MSITAARLDAASASLPYIPEPKLSDSLGVLLQNIQIPAEIAMSIASSIEADRSSMETTRERELSSLGQRLSLTRTLMDKTFEEKLLGKVDEGVYERKMRQWREEEMRLMSLLRTASAQLPHDNVLSARRILELAQNAYSVYLRANHAERGRLLKSVLSNCVTDGVSYWPTYRKPFDMIFQRGQNEEWRRERDSNPRYGFCYADRRHVVNRPLWSGTFGRPKLFLRTGRGRGFATMNAISVSKRRHSPS